MPRVKKIVDETMESKSVEAVAEADAKTEKKPRVKKAVAKEEAPVEKKAVAKKEEKKAEPKASVMIQSGTKEVAAKEVLAAAAKAYLEANGEVEIETIEIYIKPEENAVYYVVNGDDSGDNKIEFFQ